MRCATWAWDAEARAFGDYDEVVLWFEHDLFDQRCSWGHLDWFPRAPSAHRAQSHLHWRVPSSSPFTASGS
jgi:hypothetical protein